MPDTPFFPEWAARLSSMGRRLQNIRQQSLHQLDALFGPLLPSGLFAKAASGANSRDCIYTLRRTFYGFLYQVLNPGTPCREIVRQIQALLALHGLRRVDGHSGAWCLARKRLPLELLQRARHAATQCAQKREGLWRGFSVKVIDGTCISLPDTPANQRAYPQPGGQAPGCGFPSLKLVGVFSLATGALLDFAKGNKHQHETRIFRALLNAFGPGDLALADRGFASYANMAMLLAAKVPSVFRLHQSRPGDMRKGKALGKNDRLQVWKRPPQKPAGFPARLWKTLPEELSVRVLRYTVPQKGWRCRRLWLMTTLLDAQAYPAAELAGLYARRWQIELWLRDIKTTMGMEVLRTQCPEMVHRELEMFLLAYNLIRCLMAQAAARHDVALERVSFKGSVDACRQFSAAIAQARSQKRQKLLLDELLLAIARDPVPERPGRREPRAVKRRPKPYALLNRRRRNFREIPHRNGYRKDNPGKST